MNVPRHCQGQNQPPRGLGPGAVFGAEMAMQHLILVLYNDTTMSEYPKSPNMPLSERNQALADAYQRGETLAKLP